MSTDTQATELESAVIRFAGDSGDGMQLTGTRFTAEAANLGNDLRTFPDYPAEIRAPAGTLAGVSAFQINFGDEKIYTPGDQLDVLVAMNPAALKVHIGDVRKGGIVITDTAEFSKKNLDKAGYEQDPHESGELSAYTVYDIDITGLTRSNLQDSGLSAKAMTRCKNFFALGALFWMYSRDLARTMEWLQSKFKNKPELADANITALKAGYAYGENTQIFQSRYVVEAAPQEAGTYRNISGNAATAMGLVAAAQKAGKNVFLGSYPITPASDILHELAALKHFGVRTVQAEDEIAGIGTAIGASYGGALAVTTTSGPGLALKGEALGLAAVSELPLVVIDVQRGGPSTGLPTKTEQADLLQAMYGRNGECPIPIIAASTPADCFSAAYEAASIALKYTTPVLLLTDGYVANGAEPWKIPDVSSLPDIVVNEVREWDEETQGKFQPYARNPETLARDWAYLGTPGTAHRLGGLEKSHIDGGVDQSPFNHEFMVRLRQEKVNRVAHDYAPLEVLGENKGDLLLIGWGSTKGSITSAAKDLQKAGKKVSAVHLRNIYPMHPDLKKLADGFKHVACIEMNMGQLHRLMRGELLLDSLRINKIQGKPFMTLELVDKCEEILKDRYSGPFLIETIEGLNKDAPADAPVHQRYR